VKRIVVVGVGALGSHAVLFARHLGAITVVDFDRVEQKNVLAQLHPRTAVGKNKAEALRQTLLGLFAVKIDAIPHRLADNNVAQLLGGADLVVDCVDNGATRRLIQQFVRHEQKPCVHGALSADGRFGRVVWDEIFAVDDESAEGQATCEDGAILPFAGQVGATLAGVVQDWATSGRKRSLQISPAGAQIVDVR
jgi:predicted ThiF/HesA family dinucleotide-utilizing enzyme